MDKEDGWECHCGMGYTGKDCSLKASALITMPGSLKKIKWAPLSCNLKMTLHLLVWEQFHLINETLY